MKALFAILALAAFCGCAEKNEQLSVSLGIYEDGLPFWNWEGNLYSELYVGGKVTHATGSNIRAKFQKNKISISAVATLGIENIYTVKGDYTSIEPFTLHILGAGGEEGVKLKLDEGTGVIDYTGTLETTYTKPSANKAE